MAAGVPRRWQVAAIQMCSTTDRERNLSIAGRLVRQAAAGGAELIALPENFSYLHSEGTRVPCAEPLDTTDGLLMSATRSALANEDIPFVVQEEEAQGLLPVRAVLLVPRHRLDEARRIIEQVNEGSDG